MNLQEKLKIENRKTRSIKKRITAAVLSIIILLSIVLGGITSILNYSSTIDSLKLSMMETAEIAGADIASELMAYRNIVYEIGTIDKLLDKNTSIQEKRSIIDIRSEKYGFTRGNILKADGSSLFDQNNYSDREYFQMAIKGNTYASDPVISKVNGKMTMVISGPIWENGVPESKVIGVVYFVPKEDFLNKQMAEMEVGGSGAAYIINNKGVTIAHKNSELVGKENITEESKTNNSLKDLANIHKSMIAGESGFGRYTYNWEKKVVAYAPVPDAAGWSIGLATSEKDFLSGFRRALYLVTITLIIFILIGIFISRKFADTISNPIIECSKRLNMLANGDLKSSVPIIYSGDETEQLLVDLAKTIENINLSIEETSLSLSSASNGDLTHLINRKFDGDLEELGNAVNNIILSLNETLRQINISANQVACGSDQVSAGAQSLAQGATQQSSSVEELVATIEDISENINESTRNAVDAKAKVELVEVDIQKCNLKMHDMLSAMEKISDESNEISKIIKTIEDIAFQTNILALNAAVEAARAGSAGKGFAVVADEVRALAIKCAQAANSTTTLIGNSISSVESGSVIANDTGEIMNLVVKSVKDVSRLIETISESAVSEAGAISQVKQGIEQISAVVHSNSATAEESAASSEELSAQADGLNELVSRFILTNNNL